MNKSEMLAMLEKDRKRVLERLDFKARIFDDLPDGVSMPTVSNESESAFFGKPGAWLSFSRSYGEEWKASDLLASLEAAGYVPLEASLVKWDDYRATVEPGAVNEIPEVKGRYKLTSADGILPVWVRPEQFVGPEAYAYYASPSGLVLKVKVPGPAGARISARRINSVGDWRYERGSGQLHMPEAWSSLGFAMPEGRAYVDTEQGISGEIHFKPIGDKAAGMKPSELLKILEGGSS